MPTLFTKKKFRSLSLMKQHKELAKILQVALHLQDKKGALQNYNLHLTWAHTKLPPLEIDEQETLLDRFHLHSAHFSQRIRESSAPIIHQSSASVKSPSDPSICIYLDKIRYPHNIGSIARTTEAMDLGYLAFPALPHIPDLSHPQAQKSSMGTFKNLQWKSQFLQECPRPWIALEQTRDSQPIDSYEFEKKPFTLIIGNEERGVSEQVLREVDATIEIEQYGTKSCLNVACAFAICAQAIRLSWKEKKRKG